MKYHLVVSATGLLLITACTPPPKLAFESTWYFEQRVIEPAGNGIKTYSANSEEVDQGMPTSQPGNEQVSPELPPPSAVICTDLNVGVINRTPHRVPISRLELNPVDWDRKRNVPAHSGEADH